MNQYLKKCDKRRAAEEMQISLCCVFGDAELPENASSPAAPGTSLGCKYDELPEAERPRLRSPDLEAVDSGRSERFAREISTSTGVNFREAASSFEICGGSEQVMATEKVKLAPPATARIHQRKPPVCAAKTPSAAELEEFFTEAEEYVQKRFAEKYNYDIVKDAPILGGRYQWVRTHI
ncbi:cyclin-dependent kinase inhibitor 7-like isoform X2 [Salvia miltiorrhiza]|uniref:cyclin-dependent kinase inhibitor 7-like isoform X2 n=1 Tax=Salvia miltiorrhiza TaxID=226208 RepID=UPI0025AD2617|nr:cyclin-dependent kinase inhibitor 7-like isoform X2 [Salvia miltiorrhiza]